MTTFIMGGWHMDRTQVSPFVFSFPSALPPLRMGRCKAKPPHALGWLPGHLLLSQADGAGGSSLDAGTKLFVLCSHQNHEPIKPLILIKYLVSGIHLQYHKTDRDIGGDEEVLGQQ